MTVLSTPHPRALRRSVWSSAQIVRSAYIGVFQLPRIPELLLRPRLARLLVASGLPAGIAVEYQRFLSGPHALRSALHWYRGMWLPDRRATAAEAGQTASVETTYIWGNRDPALGRRAAELTRRYAGPRYRFVEVDEGHWLPQCAADAVAREVLRALGRA
jgi:hypothetical protein